MLHNSCYGGKVPEFPPSVVKVQQSCAQLMKRTMRVITALDLLRPVDGGFVTGRAYRAEASLQENQQAAVWLALAKRTGHIFLYTQDVQWIGPELETEMPITQTSELASVKRSFVELADIPLLDPLVSEEEQLRIANSACADINFISQFH